MAWAEIMATLGDVEGAIEQYARLDDEYAADHARLERLFGRRAQKADTYRRILLTTRSRPTILSHQAD